MAQDVRGGLRCAGGLGVRRKIECACTVVWQERCRLEDVAKELMESLTQWVADFLYRVFASLLAIGKWNTVLSGVF